MDPEKERKWSWLLRLLGFYSKDSVRIGRSQLYHSRTRLHIRRPEFYAYCGVTEDFQGKFMLFTLHNWMINQRLNRLPDGKAQFNSLLELFWGHAEIAMHEHGVPSISLNKKKRHLQEVGYGSFLAYDAALEYIRRGGSDEPFLAALWRNLYAGRPDINQAHFIQMKEYVWRELDNVRDTNEQEFTEGRIMWGEPPSEPVEVEIYDLDLPADPVFVIDEKRDDDI